MRIIPATAAVVALLLQLPVANRGFAQAEDSGFDRGGFTLLIGSGVGSTDNWRGGVGFAGPSFGIGGFATKNVAIMARFTGVFSGSLAYFTGLSMQYWMSNRFNVEGGPVGGVWFQGLETGGLGFGLIVGAGYTIIGSGKHSLQVSVEYAFLNDVTFGGSRVIHNFGIILRYQLL